MTGPDYPRPKPGSNAIGTMAIGVSPNTLGGSGIIGTMPPFDVWETIISQYANSPILTKLITDFAGWVDQTKNLDDFFDLIWNVDTAQGYGLDVWGRIVGVNRIVTVTQGDWFGFEEGDWQPFGQAPLFSGVPDTDNYTLSDQAYRLLILTKAFANICINTIPVMNQMLMTLFPHRGNAYVTEGNPPIAWFGFLESTTASGFNQQAFYDGEALPRMTMTYTFDFGLTPVELAIVQTSGVLPKPTGVLASVVQNHQN